MSAELFTERDAFNAFIDGRLGRAASAASLEVALREFRSYQGELAAGPQKVQEARRARDRGEDGEVDINGLIHCLRADRWRHPRSPSTGWQP